MAALEELPTIFADSGLRNKVSAAICIKAHALITAETPAANQLAWAGQALRNTSGEVEWLLKYLIASVADLDVAQIASATDAAIQTRVNEAVDTVYPTAV